MINRYHVSRNDEVVECEASFRCPLDSWHIETANKQEAETAYEHYLAEQYELFSNNKSARSSYPKWLNRSVRELIENRITTSSSIVEVSEIGNSINTEVSNRLSFSLSKLQKDAGIISHLQELGRVNNEVFSELVETGSAFQGRVVSTGGVNISKEIAPLPNTIKRLDESFLFSVKKTPKQPLYAASHKRKKRRRWIDPNTVEERVFFELPPRLENPNYYQQLFRNGAVLHEYAHHVTAIERKRLSPPRNEEKIYNIIQYNTGEEFDKSLHGEELRLPDKRMRNTSKHEIIPFASQEFFYPGSLYAQMRKDYSPFYGRAKSNTAQHILDFTVGYWVQQAIVASEITNKRT